MFATSVPTYNPPIPTAFAGALSSSDLNTKFTQSDGINDLLTLIANKATITANADANLVQNRDCTVLIPNTTTRTVTLPPLSGQIFPILVKKTSNNFSTLVVNRNASPDTIENPYASTATPTGTSFTLFLPGESYLFVPQGTYWRVQVLNPAPNQCRFRAIRGANQSIGSGTVKVAFNTDSGGTCYDIGGNFDAVTNNRFVAPFDGLYDFYCVLVMNAAAVDTFGGFYRNGVEVERFTGRHNVNTPLDLGHALLQIPMTAGQFMEVFVSGNGRTVIAGESASYFGGGLHSRL